VNRSANKFHLIWIAILCLIPIWIIFVPDKRNESEPPPVETSPASPPSPSAQSTQPAPAKTYSIADATFLGAESCRDCHSKRVNEFSETAHFRGARLPGTSDVMGNYEPGKNIYQTRDPNLRFEMTTDGTNYFQTRIEKTPDGEKRERKQAAMIYGSGLLDEIYLFWEGNRIHEMPIAYAAPLKRWINAPGYLDGHATFSHGANTCIHCHNTHIKPIAGTADEFHREGIIASISCEKCHGPGSEHVAFHHESPDETTGKHIANPETMTRKQKNDLCSECHSDLGAPRQPLFSYRPGEPLEDFYVVPEKKKSQENEHTANHIRYLEQSKCFQKSDSLSCITCHDPHVPEGAKNSLSEKRSCLGCHQPEHCEDRPNLPAVIRDQCINCHMPVRPDLHTAFHGPDKLHIPGRNRREHRIGIYDLATRQVISRNAPAPGGPAVNTPSEKATKKLWEEATSELSEEFNDLLLTRAKKFADEKQLASAMAAYREALEFATDPAPINKQLEKLTLERERFLIAFNKAVYALGKNDAESAIENLRSALEIDPKFSLALHHLGVAYQTLGNQEEAIHNFREALSLNPDLPETYTQLGVSYHMLNNLDEAIANYDRAIELNPRSSETHNNLGIAHRAKGVPARARNHYLRAIELNSRNASAHNNLGGLLQRSGDLPGAIEAYRKAITVRTNYTEAHFNLAGSLRQSGDYSGAIDSYQAAVDAGNHPGARNNLAMLLTMTGRRAEAVPHFEAVLAIQPESIPHLVFLSKILAAPGDELTRNPTRALELAQKAATITHRQYPNALDALALAQAASGEFEAATKTAGEAASIAQRVSAPELAAAIRSNAAHYRKATLPPADSLFPKTEAR
jgi:tetratricopeptide (TPR) repeat protein